MRDWLASRGELVADVVVVQESTTQTLRFFGIPYSVSLVRDAISSTAVRRQPFNLH